MWYFIGFWIVFGVSGIILLISPFWSLLSSNIIGLLELEGSFLDQFYDEVKEYKEEKIVTFENSVVLVIQYFFIEAISLCIACIISFLWVIIIPILLIGFIVYLIKNIS